jgi:hypothetical protein
MYIYTICWEHLQGMIFHVYNTPFPTMLHVWAKKNMYLSLHSVSHIISMKSKANEEEKEHYMVI